jgi:outer membrane receptor protein involved in Fe transport
MISQIQIVPGNQSSIYGSAAIAGVVNIILKKHQHGIDFQYQGGGYSDGGGTSNEISLVGGYNHGPLSLVYGLQYTRQQPIWGFQRGLTRSTVSNPNPYLAQAPFGTYEILNLGPTGFVGLDPNSIVPNACGPLGYQYGGTTTRIPVVNPTNPPQYVNGQLVYQNAGYACGSPNVEGYSTLMSKRNTASGYLSARYRINSDTEAYADLLYSVSSAAYYFGPEYSYYAVNFPQFVFFNSGTQSFQEAFTNFSPEETGGLFVPGVTSFQKSYNFFGGFKGSIGNSNWNYNAYYARSQYYLYQNQRQPVTSLINNFFQNQFLGPQTGTLTTTSGGQYPEYNPNYQNFFKPITPAQYQSLLNINHSYGTSYVQNANLEVTNTDLFKLPAGDVGAAGVLQYGDESIYNPENPQAAAGYFYNGSTTGVKARRNNYAAAVEFHIPIFSMLSTDISVRYDHFHNVGGGSSSRPTYKISFAFRPFHTLLLRANYATAFRMPPLGYVGILPGASFFQGITDYYQCEKLKPGTPFQDCSTIVNPNINYTTRGFNGNNPFLTSITAKSWGAGFVWSPTSNFNVNVDYYNIKIANEVEYQSINTLLLNDAQCILGQLPASSTACQQAFHAITRNGPTGLVTSFGVTPINVARERLDGITAGLHYTYDAGRFGTLSFAGQYNLTLKHQFQLAPGQPYLDLLHNPYDEYLYAQEGSALGPEYKSILSGSLTWAFHQWTTTLYGIRYGKMPNAAAYTNTNTYGAPLAGTLPPWILYNGSVKYDIGNDASVQLTVNNLFNSMPPRDISYSSYPYYDQGAYNPYGRSYFVNFNYRF